MLLILLPPQVTYCDGYQWADRSLGGCRGENMTLHVSVCSDSTPLCFLEHDCGCGFDKLSQCAYAPCFPEGNGILLGAPLENVAEGGVFVHLLPSGPAVLSQIVFKIHLVCSVL